MLPPPPQIDSGSLNAAISALDLEPYVEMTGDLGAADAVLALRTKLKTNSWVRGMAKFRQLPVFAVKVFS